MDKSKLLLSTILNSRLLTTGIILFLFAKPTAIALTKIFSLYVSLNLVSPPTVGIPTEFP